MVMKPVEGTLPLTEECRHYEDISEVPGDLKKSVTVSLLHPAHTRHAVHE